MGMFGFGFLFFFLWFYFFFSFGEFLNVKLDYKKQNAHSF